jgi:hypothetical protein
MITHRFGVTEYYRLGELGLFDKRTELIYGIIFDMEPITPWQADIVDTLAQSFFEQAHNRFHVRVHQPIDLGPQSQPQPDLVLCRLERYRDRHPGPADIFLVIEVTDTTLEVGLVGKRALYSVAGIAEYWGIDAQAKKLTRGMENPVSDTRISPVAFPDVSIDLVELFG